MSEDTGLTRTTLSVHSHRRHHWRCRRSMAAAVPFLASWKPSARARALGAPVEVDLSKLEDRRHDARDLARQAYLHPAALARDAGPYGCRTAAPICVIRIRRSSISSPITRSQRDAFGQARVSCRDQQLHPPGLRAGQPVSKWRPRISVRTGSAAFYCPCHGSKFDLRRARVCRRARRPPTSWCRRTVMSAIRP